MQTIKVKKDADGGRHTGYKGFSFAMESRSGGKRGTTVEKNSAADERIQVERRIK